MPFTLFLLLSFWKSIGLHWVLAFLPFVYLLAGLQLGDEQLERARRRAAIHVCAAQRVGAGQHVHPGRAALASWAPKLVGTAACTGEA